jgi:hypothetical protein
MEYINIFIHTQKHRKTHRSFLVFVRVVKDKYRGVRVTISVVCEVACRAYKLLPSVKEPCTADTIYGGTEREDVCPGGFYLKLSLTWPTN